MTLNLLAVIKQRRCGKIKGRVVANGRKERLYVPRKEAKSQTIKLGSFLISMIIDTKEDRYVVTPDIADVYLLTDSI